MDKVLKNYEELSRKKFKAIEIVAGDSIKFTWTPSGTKKDMEEFRRKYGPPTEGKNGYTLNSVTLQDGGKYSHMSIDEAVIFGAEFEDRRSLGCIALDSNNISVK